MSLLVNTVSTKTDVKGRKMNRESLENSIINKSKEVERITLGVVNKFTKELDALQSEIKEKLVNRDYTIEELEYWALILPVFSYEIGEKQEVVGIREDMSRMIRDEVFNRVILDTEGSVQHKRSEAEVQSTLELLYQTAYSRAYRIIKAKNEATQDIINSIKKVLSRALEESKKGEY